MRLDLHPAARAVRVAAAVGRADLPIHNWQPAQFRKLDALPELVDFSFGELARARPDHQAAQSLRMPGRIVDCREPATGDPRQVEPVEPEVVGKGREIAGDAPRLCAGCGVRDALAPAASIERNDTVTSR